MSSNANRRDDDVSRAVRFCFTTEAASAEKACATSDAKRSRSACARARANGG